jgi:Rha family phage regulatory protein
MHDKQAVTTSLQVAESFGKEHKNVIRDIENLLESGGSKLSSQMFAISAYANRGKQYPMYYMNRDGFTLLAMGFTGSKALQFKLQYIDAFNQLEHQVRLQVPQTLPEALRLAADLADERDQERSGRLIAEQQVGELQPKADYYDKILANKSLITITAIAKNYGWSAHKMNQELHAFKVQYNQSGSWFLYSKYQNSGYTHTEMIEVQGSDKLHPQTKWTQKGHLFIYELLKKHDIYPMIERLDVQEV